MNTSVIGARGKLIQLGDVVRRIPSSAGGCGKDYTGFVIHIYNLDLVLLEIDDGAPVSVNPVYYEPTGEKVFDIDSLPQMTRSDEREEHIKDLSERTVSLFQELYSCSRADALRHVYNIQFSVDPDMPYRDVQWYASETSESERKGEAK